jgi:hypothetical protein
MARQAEGLPPSSSTFVPAAEPALPEQEAAGAALLRAVTAEVRWEEFGAAEREGEGRRNRTREEAMAGYTVGRLVEEHWREGRGGGRVKGSQDA